MIAIILIDCGYIAHPHLAVAATGSADATDTNPPHPIHHRPSGYQIDSNKLEKFQRPLREGSNFLMHAVQ